MVSEFMLQQTPVSRVEPIWRDWVARWPTASSTAAASPADVVRAWGKLGYPRRAKRLHECAIVIARDHADQVPDDVEVLLTLPGVGSYTARAVACFAYQQSVPVVDTNVRRVVARVVHGRADAGSASAVRDHADVSALLPKDATAHIFSAALMEWGATVCNRANTEVWLVPAQPVPVATGRFPTVGRPGPSAARLRPEPTGRFVVDCWTCCAATTYRSPVISSTSSGCVTPCNATGRWNRYLPTAWWPRPATGDSPWPARKVSPQSEMTPPLGGMPEAPRREPNVQHSQRVNMLCDSHSRSSTASARREPRSCPPR